MNKQIELCLQLQLKLCQVVCNNYKILHWKIDPEINRVASNDRSAISQFSLDSIDSIDQLITINITLIHPLTRLGQISIDSIDFGVYWKIQTKRN